MVRVPRVLVLVITLSFVSCGSDGIIVEADPDCDPFFSHCGMPFPSDYFTVADDSTPTGLRVALNGAMFPSGGRAGAADTTRYDMADGWSPGTPLVFHIEGMVDSGFNRATDIGASLADDARTILLNLETGERVPHWVDQDRLIADPDAPVFIAYPAVRLDDATPYAFAVRGAVDANGAEVAANETFALYRDGAVSRADPRYAEMAQVFDGLTDAGWQRDEVQLAWRYTTRSREDITGWLLAMRDRGLAALPASGPTFRIDSIETGAEVGPGSSWETNIQYRVIGTFDAPLFMDDPEPGGRLIFGDDGLPRINPDQPTMPVRFEVLIPNVATAQDPVPFVMYGHGLFGEYDQVESGTFRDFMQTHGYAMGGIDLMGMAFDDSLWIAGEALRGAVSESYRFHDRLHQGMFNHLVFMELAKSGLQADATIGPLLHDDERHYYGISQGGIMGVVHAGLGLEFDRAALGVMGQPYALLLPRSVDFAPFFRLLEISLRRNPRDIFLGLSLVQQTWTRVEPDGWSAYVRDGVDANTPGKQIFMRLARGDHQVSNLGAHIMARTMGAAHVDTGVRPIYGFDAVSSVDTAAQPALVEYGVGLPDEPDCNVPMSLCSDPHGVVRGLDEAQQQLADFFATGQVTSTCMGACSFPQFSGCGPDDTEAASQALCMPE